MRWLLCQLGLHSRKHFLFSEHGENHYICLVAFCGHQWRAPK